MGKIDIQELIRQQRERLQYWTPERIQAQREEWERFGAEEMERARQYFPARPEQLPQRPIGDDLMEV